MTVLQLFPTETVGQFQSDAKKTAVVPVDKLQVPTFECWYAIYPRKQAKQDARKAWAKLSETSKRAAIQALPDHVEHWQAHETSRLHIPHPATWLNGMRWEDELFEAPVKKTASHELPWWSAYATMVTKAAEYGLGLARPGETTDQYKQRIVAAMEDRKRFGRAA